MKKVTLDDVPRRASRVAHRILCLGLYRIEGSQHSSFGEATLFTLGSFCLNLDLNLKRSFIFLDWLSKKSNGTSEFWEASRVKNLEPSILGSRF
jgi:hypothetical protein